MQRFWEDTNTRFYVFSRVETWSFDIKSVESDFLSHLGSSWGCGFANVCSVWFAASQHSPDRQTETLQIIWQKVRGWWWNRPTLTKKEDFLCATTNKRSVQVQYCYLATAASLKGCFDAASVDSDLAWLLCYFIYSINIMMCFLDKFSICRRCVPVWSCYSRVMTQRPIFILVLLFLPIFCYS